MQLIKPCISFPQRQCPLHITVFCICLFVCSSKIFNQLLGSAQQLLLLLTYLLLVLGEEVDAGGAAKGQARGEEPAAQVNPVLLQPLRDCQPLSLDLL